jgi:hypothetical protein
MHESIEGTQINLTCWDLNAPNYDIPCLKWEDGLLKKTKFHLGQIMSAITPIFDMYGPTGYEMGGYCNCNSESYKCRVKSTEGKLLYALPIHPKWINPTGSFQLA